MRGSTCRHRKKEGNVEAKQQINRTPNSEAALVAAQQCHFGIRMFLMFY